MKLLLIGPYPPPHGGISVHMAGVHRRLETAGVTCRVLDTSTLRPGLRFCAMLLRYALLGWTLHLHTNGHNVKSWLLVLACGLAGQARGGCMLTLHSGMTPAYLATTTPWRRRLASWSASLYSRVICVNAELGEALRAIGIDERRIEVLPAFLGVERPHVVPEPLLAAWLARHRPLLSTVLFFRPEYGFDLLVAALARLKPIYPSLGCVVMGGGEERFVAERLVHEAGLDGNILLLGDVRHDTCLAVMSACHVFLRPNRDDGDSISVREALQLGVPVVASRVGTRPPGAVLFRAGDVDEMQSALTASIANPHVGTPQGAPCMERLLEIYRTADQRAGRVCQS